MFKNKMQKPSEASVTHCLLQKVDNDKKNALMHCCEHANVQTASFILEQCDDKTKELLIDQECVTNIGSHSLDGPMQNCFQAAIIGGNMVLIKKIHDVYRQFNKAEKLVKCMPLQLAFHQGAMDVVEWILFEFIKSGEKRVLFLNGAISSCKSGRKLVEHAKRVTTKGLERDLKPIETQRDIGGIWQLFEWVMKQDDMYCVGLIMDKLKKDDDAFKTMWFDMVKCMDYACANRKELLQLFLNFLGSFYQPLLKGASNALVNAIRARSEACVSLIFDTVKSAEIKDQLIETKDVEKNALIWCVWRKNNRLVNLVVKNHSDPGPILGVSFRFCLWNEGFVESARFLLSQSDNKSIVLNEKGVRGMTVLHSAVQRRTDECLKFIVSELQEDHKQSMAASLERGTTTKTTTKRTASEEEKKDDDEDEVKVELIFDDEENSTDDTHPMFFATTNDGYSILHALLMSKSANKSLVEVLETVLSKKQIRRLLLSPSLYDELPLHCVAKTIDTEMLDWVLRQFEHEPLQSFKMIAGRNKFGNTMWNKVTEKPMQTFLGHKLIECVKSVDVAQLDMHTLKEMFRMTLKWKMPKLQSLILFKVDSEHHAVLLNSEGLNTKQSLICDLVDVDHPEMAKTVLSVVKNQQMMLFCNPLLHAIQSSNSSVIGLIMEAITDEAVMLQFVTESNGQSTPLSEAYLYKNRLLHLILSKIPNSER